MVIVDPGRKLSCLHGSRRSWSSICPHPPSPAFLTPSYFLVPLSPPLLDLDPLQQKCSFSEFSEFSVCPGEASKQIRAEPSSNGCAGLLRTKKSELSVHQMAVRTTFGQKAELSVYQMAIEAKLPLSLHFTEILLCLSKHTCR